VALTNAAASELSKGELLRMSEHSVSRIRLADRLACGAIPSAEALARYRRPAEQRIVVERPMVADDGQAVVGTVGGGGSS
jgi:hypothetical protein